MKNFIKFLILILCILIIIFFYRTYLNSNSSDVNEVIINKIDKNIDASTKNFIKNLKYEVTLNDKSKYKIHAISSKIKYVDGHEYVDMNNVNAIITDKYRDNISIISDVADYNSFNHNTSFQKNVKVKYLDNDIECEKIYLNFMNQSILIKDNVRFKSNNSFIKADIIKINLLTKKVEILMNEKQDKIQIYKN